MAKPHELVPGNCYFLMNFYDDDLKVPDVSTLIYEQEAEAEEDGEKLWLFREPPSYSPGDDSDVVEGEQADVPIRTGIRVEQLHQILDLNGLIAHLGELIDLHPLLPLPPVAPGSLQPRKEIPELASLVAKVLGFDGRHSVTMTIRYTDNGFSIGRHEDGLHASFFPNVHREAGVERAIRAVFAELGIPPREDYLSQHGRVRVLTYPLPAEQAFLEKLAKRMLIDVYRMRQDDELELSWNQY